MIFFRSSFQHYKPLNAKYPEWQADPLTAYQLLRLKHPVPGTCHSIIRA